MCGPPLYGNYHEIAALAAIQQPALIVFVGDHRQTPGGLSKGRAAAANRQKLLHRPLGLRALNRSGDYLPPARLAKLIALLWPDASREGAPLSWKDFVVQSKVREGDVLLLHALLVQNQNPSSLEHMMKVTSLKRLQCRQS